ncbi:hypothetical protein J2T57_002676 [Natronocella acetinitrilica]|jgi:hypothetical protein|uniref:Cation/multidrug efflux pump n=1 Tax=Natronocella acetinitrilica TaxID=414046 RepID=A0AAE3G4A1_9GAMM|nr:hypothetical protein [Natronocella acetinitrilica]MCP1675526.1 hypothetical protein [Natronocella acetinitrilica]
MGINLTWIAALVAAGGAGLLVLGVVRLYRLRIVAGCGHCTIGAALAAVGVAGVGAAANLHSYDRLTHERPVMEIRFVENQPRQYTALVYHEGSADVQRFDISGDEWQLDARILKWTGPAIISGLDSYYRLERLSGRYRDVDSERSLNRSVYDLSEGVGIDLWRVAREHQRWMPWLDSVYGNAAYLPMSDEARFQVTVTQAGLVARPLNANAQTAVERWR